MTRGDQRDRDREKNLKKQQDKLKAQGKEGNPLARNLNDAAALQQKIAMKQAQMKEQQEEASRAASQVKVERKKKPDSADARLDDLLAVGLSGIKKK